MNTDWTTAIMLILFSFVFVMAIFADRRKNSYRPDLRSTADRLIQCRRRHHHH